jgi:hypothetical protein
MLLYADDIVLLARTAGALQKYLNILEEYCDTWTLRVIVGKTKIMAFRKLPQVTCHKDQINGLKVIHVLVITNKPTNFGSSGRKHAQAIDRNRFSAKSYIDIDPRLTDLKVNRVHLLS